MDYPLAHDESGRPLEVPGAAAGWLVRRHSGGRGRPAAVYDGQGRPLVVPLEATAEDLRAHGCRAGMYRLEAVDSSRRPLDVVAYTAVTADGGDGGVGDAGVVPGVDRSDAAVAALAKAVEAMQRVQAERERASAERERIQSEMISRLIDRLAPSAPEVPRNLRDALGEFTDVQQIIRKLAPEGEATVDEASGPWAELAPVIQQAVSLATVYVQQKLGGPAAAASSAADGAASGTAEGDAAEVSGSDNVGEAAEMAPKEVEKKLDAVFALLTVEEAAAVRKLGTKLPPAILRQAMQRVVSLPAEEAAAEVRRLLGNRGKDKPNGKPPGGGVTN